jgi:hypothetical protein
MQHFVHWLRTLKSEIWKKPKLAGWGAIQNFFERIEFQNRGAAHTHGCYWTEKPISEMITKGSLGATYQTLLVNLNFMQWFYNTNVIHVSLLYVVVHFQTINAARKVFCVRFHQAHTKIQKTTYTSMSVLKMKTNGLFLIIHQL